MELEVNLFKLYHVTKLGDVFNVNTGRLISTLIDGQGYSVVHLYYEKDKKKALRVCDLVAKLYLLTPVFRAGYKPYVHHIDLIRTNNRWDNLEYRLK